MGSAKEKVPLDTRGKLASCLDIESIAILGFFFWGKLELGGNYTLWTNQIWVY